MNDEQKTGGIVLFWPEEQDRGNYTMVEITHEINANEYHTTTFIVVPEAIVSIKIHEIQGKPVYKAVEKKEK